MAIGPAKVQVFQWTMSTPAHSCTSLCLDANTTQLALKPFQPVFMALQLQSRFPVGSLVQMKLERVQGHALIVTWEIEV